ncbi:MAG TPA: lantibiotic dehydratase [Micromonosporaceae bacterium]
MTAVPVTDSHVPLGRTRWSLWPDAALRGAGFPAERFLDICDDELATAADQWDDTQPVTREQYAKAYAAATDRLSAAVRRTAAEPTFREAVTWQNPGLIPDCLDKVVAGERRNSRGRNHELAIATYLQRYCLKNDSVGFFGPIGWARFETDDAGVRVVPGPDLVCRRTTYFEDWAISAIADVIASRAEVWPWLRPRVAPSATVSGRVVRLPFRKPLTLSVAEARVLGQCDGRRTVRDIAGDPPDPATVAALLRLREWGAVRIDLTGAMVTFPERELAERIDAIADPGVRARARVPLDEIVRARDAVSAAAGDPDRLLAASRALGETFERLTGNASTRRSGVTYAGRTLVYEDTIRAVDVRLGRGVTDRLAPPLGLVLDSAVWLANAIGDRYEAKARQMLDRELALSGNDSMPLLQLLTAVMPEIGRTDGAGLRSEIVDEVVVEFQRRWQRVLDLPSDALDRMRRHQVAADAIAERVAEEFATEPPRWSGAQWHSPDIMLSADDADALDRGDVDFVLGELHCASNTLESQLFPAQHPEPERLRAAAEASGLDRRMFIIPRMDSPVATSRMSRATELMLPSYTYLCIGSESMAPPPGADVLSVLDLEVRRRGDALVVRHVGRGDEHRFLDAAGEPLSALVADAFRPLDAARHRPRVTIDRLVVTRESWRFAADEPAWAFDNDEARRYARARRWRAEHGIPERGFVRVPVERKPLAVDFRSLPLVNLLAKLIRRTAEAGAGQVTITEMLPDIDRLWLRDARGARYTAELRVVVVGPR